MKLDVSLKELKIIVRDYEGIMNARRVLNNTNLVPQDIKNQMVDDDIIRMNLLKRFKKLLEEKIK